MVVRLAPVYWVDEARYRAWATWRRLRCKLDGGHRMRPWRSLGAYEFRVCGRCPHVEERRSRRAHPESDERAVARLAAAVADRLREP
jgi:hypothetical protein